ncbi:MAG: DUF4351 domain-containing protein [Magnetococcales bacterium]|nr:DUF4351 domain-containing protein [Magnetococcales bacterium]
MKDSLISPAMETITPQYLSQLGQEWFDFILNTTPDEKLFSQPKIEHRLMQEHRKGESAILIRLLHRRFGNLPAWVQEKIAEAEPSSLENWSLRFIDAQSLNDVFADKE